MGIKAWIEKNLVADEPDYAREVAYAEGEFYTPEDVGLVPDTLSSDMTTVKRPASAESKQESSE